MCECMCECMYVCMCECMYACMCECMCEYLYFVRRGHNCITVNLYLLLVNKICLNQYIVGLHIVQNCAALQKYLILCISQPFMWYIYIIMFIICIHYDMLQGILLQLYFGLFIRHIVHTEEDIYCLLKSGIF